MDRCCLCLALLVPFTGALAARGDDYPLAAQGPRLPPITPPAAEELEQAIRRGVEFLLVDQNKDGSWGSAERTKDLNIFAPVPGAHDAFRTATSALCLSALLELQSSEPRVVAAVEKGEQWLLDHLRRLRRADQVALYNVWGHAYAIQALARMHARMPQESARQQQIVELIRSQLDYLDRYESVDGGWGYYDFRVGARKPTSSSTSFVTATVLVAFHEARQIGIEPPPKLVARGVASIQRQRKPDFSYAYAEDLRLMPMVDINRPGGSLGRSQACNLALRLWGDDRVTDPILVAWLHRLFARNGWLSIGRKRPIPHESWFMVAGYFYYYGHYYAAQCIEQLPPSDRPLLQSHLARILLDLQEKDGSWWDYPLYNYHQQYGTAYALMTLLRCRSTTGAAE